MTLDDLITKLQTIQATLRQAPCRVDAVIATSRGTNTIGHIEGVDVMRFPLESPLPLVVLWGKVIEET